MVMVIMIAYSATSFAGIGISYTHCDFQVDQNTLKIVTSVNNKKTGEVHALSVNAHEIDVVYERNGKYEIAVQNKNTGERIKSYVFYSMSSKSGNIGVPMYFYISPKELNDISSKITINWEGMEKL